MGRMWENLNSRCNTTTMAKRTGGLTNLSRLPSSFSSLSTQLLPFPSLSTVKENFPPMLYNQFWCMIRFLYCLLFSSNSNSSWVSLTRSNLIKLEIGHLVCFNFCLVTIWNGYGQLSVNNLIQSKSFKKCGKTVKCIKRKKHKSLMVKTCIIKQLLHNKRVLNH